MKCKVHIELPHIFLFCFIVFPDLFLLQAAYNWLQQVAKGVCVRPPFIDLDNRTLAPWDQPRPTRISSLLNQGAQQAQVLLEQPAGEGNGADGGGCARLLYCSTAAAAIPQCAHPCMRQPEWTSPRRRAHSHVHIGRVSPWTASSQARWGTCHTSGRCVRPAERGTWHARLPRRPRHATPVWTLCVHTTP